MKIDIHRNSQLDFVRIVAILLVFYNHYYCYDFFLNSSNPGILHYILLIPSIICKCGPTLFFMISGALLLKRKENYSSDVFRRVKKFSVAIFAIVFLKFCFNRSFSNAVSLLLNGLNWYFYAYLGFLLLLPVYRSIVSNLKIEDWKYIFILVIITNILFSIFRVLNIDVAVLNNLQPLASPWASSAWQCIFPLMGYFIIENKELFIKYEKKIFSGCLISILLSMILIRIDIIKNGGANYEMLHQYYTILPSIYIFGSIISEDKKMSKNIYLNKFISICAPLTFGMFILETQTNLGGFLFMKMYQLLGANMKRILISWIAIILKFIIFSIIVYLLRLIPLVRRYI